MFKKKIFFITGMLIMLLSRTTLADVTNTNYCTKYMPSWFNVINKLTGPHATTIEVYFANVSGDCTDTSNGGGSFGSFLTGNDSDHPMSLEPGQSITSRAQVLGGYRPYDIVRGLFMDVNPQNRDANCKFDTYVSWTDPITKKYYSYHFGSQLESVSKSNYCHIFVKDFQSVSNFGSMN